jgi:hypothetical protein
MTEYPIGTKFQTSGKYPLVCTVVDVWKTYNLKNELVRTRYVATHKFMGHTLTNFDVVAATITRGFIS